MAQWLNLSSYRPLVLPVSLLMVAVTSYDLPDLALLTHFLTSVVPFDLMLFTIVLPGILVLLSLIRGSLKNRVRRKFSGRKPVADPG
jgi:spore germination protein KB